MPAFQSPDRPARSPASSSDHRSSGSCAKTGTLTDVTGLAGVVDVGRRLTFAYLDNGDFSRDQGDADHVNVGNIIGRYPDSPPVDALVPPPQ